MKDFRSEKTIKLLVEVWVIKIMLMDEEEQAIEGKNRYYTSLVVRLREEI